MTYQLVQSSTQLLWALPSSLKQLVILELVTKYIYRLLCPLLHSLLAYIWYIFVWIWLLLINSSLTIVTILKVRYHFLICHAGKYLLPPSIIFFVICFYTHPIWFSFTTMSMRLCTRSDGLVSLTFWHWFLNQIFLSFFYIIIPVVSFVYTSFNRHVIKFVWIYHWMLWEIWLFLHQSSSEYKLILLMSINFPPKNLNWIQNQCNWAFWA